MGLQLILVVETNEKCKSDWIYIKETIEFFYQYDQAQTKFTPVYMNGKGKYKTKEKEIRTAKSQYAHSNKESQFIVIYFFDCDKYDIDPADAQFLREAKQYCDAKGYEFVWFCKDIEQVYPGKRRPYYLKSEGKPDGVYIRVPGSTRVADDFIVKELEFQGSNRSYDQIMAICF